MSNFLLGGRTGDLIHALYVVKNTPGKHDLFITDRRDLHSDGFHYPLEKTFEELTPIIKTQDYCNSFQIYKDEECINLSMWRRYAYTASWTQLLSNTFNIPANGEPWIKIDKQFGWDERIVIHASMVEARRGFHWQLIMDKYEGQCVFIGNKNEYEAFPFKVPRLEPDNLESYFKIINGCKFFIGNQSAPLAIAHSLGTPRLAVLNEVDKIHYVGEEKFHNGFYWIAQHEHHWEGINF